MNSEIAFALFGGAAIGFVFGIHYADSSHRRMETASTVRQIELLRGEVERVLHYIKP